MHYVPNSTENQHYCTYSDHATQLYPTSANHISKENEKEHQCCLIIDQWSSLPGFLVIGYWQFLTASILHWSFGQQSSLSSPFSDQTKNNQNPPCGKLSVWTCVSHASGTILATCTSVQGKSSTVKEWEIWFILYFIQFSFIIVQ